MTDIQNFLDNLNIFFTDPEENNARIIAEAFKNEEGKIYEIRIFNPEYNEFIVINERGQIECTTVDQEVILNILKTQKPKKS